MVLQLCKSHRGSRALFERQRNACFERPVLPATTQLLSLTKKKLCERGVICCRHRRRCCCRCYVLLFGCFSFDCIWSDIFLSHSGVHVPALLNCCHQTTAACVRARMPLDRCVFDTFVCMHTHKLLYLNRTVILSVTLCPKPVN